MEVNDFLITLRSLNEPDKYDNLIVSLEKLSQLCSILIRVAPHYDWKNLPYNGYRSIIKLCDLFIINVCRKNYHSIQFHDSSIGVIELLIAIVSRALEYHENAQQRPNQGFNKDLVVKVFRDLNQHYVQIRPNLKSYWGHHGLYWMTPDSRWVPNLFSLLYSLVHRFPKSLLASISADEYADTMTFSTWKATLFFPINLANYVDNFISRTYSGLRFMVSGVECREFQVPRQSRWIISDDGSRLTDPSSLFNSSDPELDQPRTVLCHLMRHKSEKPSGDIIIHAQGGGLVVDARQLHEEYLRDWVKQLNGSVIINVAYSRFVRYPCALQEILDVFLWITSGGEQISQTLGFQPKRVILLGDSAGAYLLFSLCLTLRDIQSQYPSEISIYPKALVALSPIVSSATTQIFPSFLLSYVDAFLCPSLLLHCFSLYGSGVIFDSDCIDLDNNPDDCPTASNWSTWLKDKYSTATTNFENFYNTWIKKGKSWYDCDQETFENRANKMASRITIPYISPLVSYNLETINDLELYLISTEFDPLLDTNIELANKWSGKLTFDVIEQMSHGFCAYYSLSNTCYQASQLCLQRLKEAIS